MGAPYSGGSIHGPAFSDVAEKVDWVERFVRLGTQATEAARTEQRDRCCASSWLASQTQGRGVPTHR